MRRSILLLLLYVLVACTQAGIVSAQAGPIGVDDPICGFPGTRSGSQQDWLKHDDPRVSSSEKAHVVGKIVNIDGLRLRDASATIVGTNLGSRADSSGVFRLDAVPGTLVLRMRSIGYLPQDHTLYPIGGRTDTLCVRLRAHPVGLAPVGFNDIVTPITRPPK